MLACLVAAAGVNAADNWAWPIERGSDPRTYQETVSTGQDSRSAVLDESATSEVFPRLILQCTPGDGDSMRARIDWRRFISSFNADISFTADSKKRLWLKFGVDSSNKITLAKSADDTSSLIGYLAGATTLTVRVTPYSESEIEASYDLAGLDDAITALTAKCGGDH